MLRAQSAPPGAPRHPARPGRFRSPGSARSLSFRQQAAVEALDLRPVLVVTGCVAVAVGNEPLVLAIEVESPVFVESPSLIMAQCRLGCFSLSSQGNQRQLPPFKSQTQWPTATTTARPGHEHGPRRRNRPARPAQLPGGRHHCDSSDPSARSGAQAEPHPGPRRDHEG
jgi:hypothetical protein